MLPQTAFSKSIWILVVFYVLPFAAFANVVAGFTVSQPGGCAPLMVTFTNTTTGASAAATYEWNFGNGHTSILKDAAAIFEQEKTYTVTLTVKDGATTSVKTETVTVYKKPTVDFNVSLDKGCTPLPITFNSSSTAGDGTIRTLFWDFGDGSTAQTGPVPATHTYTFENKPSVTLTVTNSFGCSNSKTVANVANIYKGVQARFEADKSFVCLLTDKVTMINNSAGDASLTYQWNFGDGNTSTLKNPEHTFDKKGTYSVQLAVKDAKGCTDTMVKSGYLNVANFQSAISVPDIICKEAPVEFKNNSTPAPTSSQWRVDGQVLWLNWYNKYEHTFTTAGRHEIELTNTFGTCIEKVTKVVDVKELLQPKGFEVEVPKYCFLPVTVTFKDTTTGAVEAGWNLERLSSPFEPQVYGKTVSFTYRHRYNMVTLYVKDANGCRSKVEQVVELPEPDVFISTTDNNTNEGCESLTKKFKFTTAETITSFNWEFGDGATSTHATPEHTYKVGHYAVKLNYTTAKGCSGTSYLFSIRVFAKPKSYFHVIGDSTICGNTRVTFQSNNSNGHPWDFWKINDKYVGTSSYGRYDYQFQDTGKYTISLISYNDGCRDTMTREAYIHVKPAFPKIKTVVNTCEGDRSLVTFDNASLYAEKWTWNWGDGTVETFDTDKPMVTHKYTKTGQYKVVLTTTNGSCTTQDSTYAYVMLKQKPVLTAAKTEVCIDEGLKYTLSNLERSAYPYIWVHHRIRGYQYEDGSTYMFDSLFWYDYDHWIDGSKIPYSGHFTQLQKGHDQIRVITQQPHLSCQDTSNFIPITIIGAQAGFQIQNNGVCSGVPVYFKDTSNAYNSTIRSWDYDFGDGTKETHSQGGTLSHVYKNPGTYKVILKVTDSGGCSSTTSTGVQMVNIKGPKAAFTPSGTTVPLNTTVYFYNQTNNHLNNDTRYEWQFGEGSTSTVFSPSHTYATAGEYLVKLIVSSATTGCRDTVVQKIIVKKFFSHFTYSHTFLTTNSCPPVLVHFQNTSTNFTSVKWDFGDGTVSENNSYPSHVYTKPGRYGVSITVTGSNNDVSTHTDSITIAAPTASVEADLWRACIAQGLTLRTTAQNATTYFWDFGDGTIRTGNDTFAVHRFGTAGTYRPKLLVKDAGGCAVLQNSSQPIVIDKLQVAMPRLPATMCTPKEVLFTPTIQLTSGDGTTQNLTYHWNFGTGDAKDTANVQNPSFSFLQPGTFPIELNVQSPAGCIQKVSSVLTAFQGLGGKINGPAEICQQASAQFTGSTLLPGQPKWEWIFHDGTKVQAQNAPAKVYTTAGMYDVKLVVDNGGCIDTVVHQLLVNHTPVAQLAQSQINLCLNNSVTLTASGGSNYSWAPSAGLQTTNGASVQASPINNTTYTVTVTSDKGCVATNTVAVNVVRPMQVLLPANYTVCAGEAVQLKASGAAAYQWIQNTAGLSNSQIANPVAQPSTTMAYTVVGTDAYKCFKDTAVARVTVHPLPMVNAGPDVEIMTGSSHQLSAVASADVVRYQWSPATYLSCTNCAAPEARPMQPVEYILKVTNADNCTATDTVAIQLMCSESRVYIPDAFSPNGDGKNDLFSIKGQGIRTIKYMRIFNRWGEMVFERKDFEVGDTKGAWNGKYKGQLVPSGSYIYFAEMSCNEQTFTRKGTVTVVY